MIQQESYNIMREITASSNQDKRTINNKIQFENRTTIGKKQNRIPNDKINN